ncbi:salicylate hydroxylase [Breoghania corrubedonensis]|uniref:Salicylate hydroxylase n=1 Tax=Breoghania corrubedonensis TaxID=665038 RepID=A0A2T5VD26_9HYPH|nr:FAD-dependent monooxygenase [Breoghania corrubedonensis]PTW61660.1 salicylate hydroxylase [Breoghania corrubedonensis]
MTSPSTRGPGPDGSPDEENDASAASNPTRRIVVAGGGIGGLTAALALERVGFSVLVLERSDKLGEVGAGIQISPNAWRVLDELGAIPATEAAMVYPEATRIGSARAGGIVGRVPFGETARHRYGAPYAVIHRGDLHAGLAETARSRPGIEIHLGMAVADAQEDEDGITVEIQGSEGVSSYRAEALIAADGVWSTVRRRLLRLPSADYSGRVAFRATVPVEAAPDLASFTGLWMGEKSHLVHYPISAGREINLVAIVESDWHEETWSAPAERDEVLGYFKDWPQEPRRLLEHPHNWLKWALCDIGPGAIWAEGRIALLGDAAHAMLPFMAQGGAMAIEDAYVVARCLANDPDVDEALLAYERARKDRVERVMRTARDNARTYHMKGMMAFLRDTGIRYLSGTRLLSRFDWIYDWRP